MPFYIGHLKRKGCGAHRQMGQELFRAALRFARVLSMTAHAHSEPGPPLRPPLLSLPIHHENSCR